MKTTFYSPNGWEGKRYQPGMRVKDVAKEVREFIKKDADLSSCKWSVTCDKGTFTSSLYIALMEAPFEPFSDEFKEKHSFGYGQGYSQHGTCKDFVTSECLQVMEKMKAFVLQYIHDDSNGMIDYFDRNIYDHYEIGKYDKPFKMREAKGKVVKKEAPAKQTVYIQADGLQLVDYSEKAFVLIGDTKAIKDKLKELGGRFNARLSCGAGWIFSKKKEAEVKAALSIYPARF